MSNKIKVLVSVYNISGYLMAELAELSKTAEIAVIETPCKGIPKEECVSQWIDRTKVDSVSRLGALLSDFKPDVFLCGGWVDRLCLEFAKILHAEGCKTVLLIDTPWQGKLKQFLHCLYSRFYLTPTFDFAWGAGEPQERYLRYLGFPLERIRRGYYCADTNKFAPVGKARFQALTTNHQPLTTNVWPHVFLYVGRYVAVKNMRRMERAFLKALEKMPESDWTLKCIGGGELWDERTIHPRIEHLGYKGPAEIQEHVKDAGCFVLPSVYEPWGVVVHEAALMGLPMLCSNQIQAATAYLKDGENGYVFDPLNEDEILSAFIGMMHKSDTDLRTMGRCSHRLGLSYSLQDWVQTVKGFVQ